MTPSEPPRPQLVGLRIGDPPARWEALGFTVNDGLLELEGLTIALGPSDPAPSRGPEHASTGILSWTLSGVPDATTEIDGLPTIVGPANLDRATPKRIAHENGAVGVDHVVVLTPNFERSKARLEAVGMPLRRIREVPGASGGAAIRQGFRRLGPAILELVETPHGAAESASAAESAGGAESASPAPGGPAAFWGLVMVVSDLDVLSVRLGDRLGAVRDAVQPGRRIATLRAAAGLGLPVAFMDCDPT